MKCLFCYNELEKQQQDFHPSCSRKIFGKPEAPLLAYTESEMLQLAETVIKSRIAVTGVQPKLSLDIKKVSRQSAGAKEPVRFTIVGLWGGYILKPPSKLYSHLPELEDLTMHLAQMAGIQTVPHSLIRLQSGNLAYITKRIDRNGNKKLHMEDMCQLTERLTEDKYKGSYEQIAKAILKYAANPGLDLVNFFEQVVFSFVTGNADMHLKNFSLIQQSYGSANYVLTPAYDMVASALVVKGDEEEMALNLNGKKRRIMRSDFDALSQHFSLVSRKSVENIFAKFSTVIPQWQKFIEKSFIPQDMKDQYLQLINQRAEKLRLI
jgi:serine/threonine-protein kinase HipA